MLCRIGWLQNHTDPSASLPRRDQSLGHPSWLAMTYPSHQKLTPQKLREKTPQQQQRVNHMIKRPVGWGDICKSDLLRVNSQHLNQAPMTNRKKKYLIDFKRPKDLNRRFGKGCKHSGQHIITAGINSRNANQSHPEGHPPPVRASVLRRTKSQSLAVFLRV